MYEIYPHMFLSPLVIVGIDVLSIAVEYFQEHLIGELIDRQTAQAWRPFGPFFLEGGLTWEAVSQRIIMDSYY